MQLGEQDKVEMRDLNDGSLEARRRVFCAFYAKIDCLQSLRNFIQTELGGTEINIELVELERFEFSVDRVIESFKELFHKAGEAVPGWSLHWRGYNRLQALALMVERGFATPHTLCKEIPKLEINEAKAIVDELYHQGKIAREARGIYTIADLEEVYQDEVVEFRMIAECFKPTPAELELLSHLDDGATKVDLIDRMRVSRQRVDQLTKRLLEKQLLRSDGSVLSKTTLCKHILNRTSVFPL